MKKALALIAMVIVALVVFTASVFAGTYTVQKGDTLSGIAKKHGIKSWRSIATLNHLTNPNRIRVGQVLQVSAKAVVAPAVKQKPENASEVKSWFWPDPNRIRAGRVLQFSTKPVVAPAVKQKSTDSNGYWYWRFAGFAKYCGQSDDALGQFGLPKEVEAMFASAVAKKDFTRADIGLGEYFEAMVNGPPTNLKLRVVTAWTNTKSEKVNLYVVEYEGMKYSLYRFDICGNWAWRKEPLPPPKEVYVAPPPKLAPPEPVYVTPVAEPEVWAIPLTVEPEPISATPVEMAAPVETECADCRSEVELLASVGGYTNRHAEIEADGTYADVLFQLWPCLDFQIGNVTNKVGPFAQVFNAQGDSSGYKYNVDRYTLGVALKSTAPNWENVSRIGYFRMDSEGEEGLFSQKQNDGGAVVTNYFNWNKRLNEGKKWWNRWSVGSEFLYPLSSSREAYWDGKSLPGKSWDNKSLAMKGNVSVVDLPFGSGYVFTPGIIVAEEYNYGLPSWYYTVGLSGTLKRYGSEFVQLTATHKEELGGDGDFFQVGLFVNALETYKVVKSLTTK